MWMYGVRDIIVQNKCYADQMVLDKMVGYRALETKPWPTNIYWLGMLYIYKYKQTIMDWYNSKYKQVAADFNTASGSTKVILFGGE